MNSETKTCQNCKQNFVIEPEDFAFYEKINVPPPTWCPECRMVRRMSFRGNRFLYKRRVEGADKEVWSRFHPDSPVTVYHENYYYSDSWDALEYGMEIDFSKPFLSQLKGLFYRVPKPHRYVISAENSDYCDNAGSIKNCYLCFNIGFSENCMYGQDINSCKEVIDALKAEKAELSYDIFNCSECYRVFFSSNITHGNEIFFSDRLVGCEYCFGCVNLRNKKYHIFNKPYSKEDYFKEIKKYDTGSFVSVLEAREKARELKLRFPVKYMEGAHNAGATGDYVDHSANVRNSFFCTNLKDAAYCQFVLFLPSNDILDMTIGGGAGLCYEGCESAGGGMKFCWGVIPKIAGGALSAGASSMEYSILMQNSSNCFGCVGLRGKNYCILNKQYTKDEYNALVPKIVEYMKNAPYIDRQGKEYRYGEFFPPEFSPFVYNETIAQEYFPLTKEKAAELGYEWREPNKKDYGITKNSGELPDHIKDVNDSIVDEVIGCAHEGKCAEQCASVFRITPGELSFYKKMNLALPRLCHNCRHYERAKQRNPFRLWRRKCQCAGAKSASGVYNNQMAHLHNSNPCHNEFVTSYSPDRTEIVYCESCYNSEMV